MAGGVLQKCLVRPTQLVQIKSYLFFQEWSSQCLMDCSFLCFNGQEFPLASILGLQKLELTSKSKKNSTAGPFAFLQLSHLSVQLPTQRISCNSGDAGRRPGASWDASGA